VRYRFPGQLEYDTTVDTSSLSVQEATDALRHFIGRNEPQAFARLSAEIPNRFGL